MLEKLKVLLWENLYPRQIVLKNAFWLYLGEIISKGLRVLIFLLIARVLGPANFGIFEYFLSFIGLFFLFADFGVSSIFIRDYQQKEEKGLLINNAFLLKLFASLIFGLIALSGYFLARKLDGLLLYLIFVLFYIFQNIENFFEAYFIALEKAEKKFLFNTFASLALFIFVALGLFLKKNVFVVALAYLLSMLAGLWLAYFFFKKETRLTFKIDLFWIKYYLFNGLPLALFGLLGYIFFSTDKIFLSHLKGVEETGYYSAASRIVSAFFLISSIFNTALYPWLAKKVKRDKLPIKKIFPISILASILIAFLFSLVIFILAPFLVTLIFGNQFLKSILILQLLIWILVFVYPTNFLDLFLISNNRQWLDFGLTVIPAILNIILNLMLIPPYGVLGAVYASLTSQALNFLLTLLASIYVLRKDFAK